MQELNLEQVKNILMELTDEIHEICCRHDLKYFLSGGTLIGAIRHNGFIPWDDDIDLYMPRPDYDKFIKIYNSVGKNKLLEQSIVAEYKYPFAKLVKPNTLLIEKSGYAGVEMGVYVDIFPIDALGDSEESAKVLMKKINPYIVLNLSLLVSQWRKEVSMVKNLAIWNVRNLALLMGGHKKLLAKINKIVRFYDYDSSKFVGEYIDEIGNKRIMPREVFESAILHDFEDRKYFIPIGYHKFLTSFYGDYMQLPPIEKQVLTHGYKAYIKEETYS